MATVQISFQDASNNEDFFTIYRGDASGNAPTGTTAEVVATITWDGTSNWVIADGALGNTSSAFVAGQVTTNDPSNVGQSFGMQYTESNAGTYVYGVEAENSIGKSAITNSSSITIT